MILDIILVVLFIFTIIFGYKKGCVAIVAKLVSVIIALLLAYLFADELGSYIKSTEYGTNMQVSLENTIINKLDSSEETIISAVHQQLGHKNEKNIINQLVNYVFIGLGFVTIFLISKIVLWVAQKVIESIFELPILKTFNKLGGIVIALVVLLIEVAVILAVIRSVSMFNFMNKVINYIQSSIITQALYNHNIFTHLILSKII